MIFCNSMLLGHCLVSGVPASSAPIKGARRSIGHERTPRSGYPALRCRVDTQIPARDETTQGRDGGSAPQPWSWPMNGGLAGDSCVVTDLAPSSLPTFDMGQIENFFSNNCTIYRHPTFRYTQRSAGNFVLYQCVSLGEPYGLATNGQYQALCGES